MGKMSLPANDYSSFVVNYLEIEDRLDPKMLLYKRGVGRSGLYMVRVADIIKGRPQYGAGEPGVPRTKMDAPRYIRISDIDENGCINPEEMGASIASFDNRFLLHEDDLLIARSGATVGKAYLHKSLPYPCFFAGYLIRFVIDSSIAYPGYVFAYTQLSQYKVWVDAVQRVSAQPNINAEEFKELEIPFPEMEQQKRIAAKFKEALLFKYACDSKSDSFLSDVQNAIIEHLSISLKPSTDTIKTFKSSFLDLDGGRLDPQYAFVIDRKAASKYYPNIPLDNIVSFYNGGHISERQVIPGVVPVIGAGKQSPYSHAFPNFEGNIITVSSSGAYAGFVMYHSLPIFASDCFVMSSKNEDLFLTKYIYIVLSIQQDYIYQLQTGSAQPHVQPSDIKDLLVPAAPKEVQMRIIADYDKAQQSASDLRDKGNVFLARVKSEIEKELFN